MPRGNHHGHALEGRVPGIARFRQCHDDIQVEWLTVYGRCMSAGCNFFIQSPRKEALFPGLNLDGFREMIPPFPSNLTTMKSPRILAAIIIAVGTRAPAAAEETPQKPNIIFILSDDLGIGSVSSYGADHFKTPNIDKLAKTGIRFEHCYSSPICGPSRALLMTGRYAFRTGMTYNDTGGLLKPANEIMMPKVLKAAGYATAQVGKWAQLPLQPSDWGFDEYLRFNGSGKYWNTQPGNKTYTENGRLVPLMDGEYLPDKMHEFVVDFITRHRDQPFYIYYAMSHVHEPILRTPDSLPGSRHLYRDNVAYMDKLVGKLIDVLDQQWLRRKTIVIFSSDNGTAPRFKWRCTIDGGKQLSGCKFTMLECGALVPMIVNWPGTAPAGEVSDNLISFVDFLPTLAELGGTKPPDGVTIDGKPFTSIFYGKPLTSPRDWIFVMLDSLWYDRDMIWKVDQSGELFDMKNAPFKEPMVPAGAQNPAAVAARQRLQGVLTQLDPADGKHGPAYGTHVGQIRNVTNRSFHGPGMMDTQNANAPDQ